MLCVYFTVVFVWVILGWFTAKVKIPSRREIKRERKREAPQKHNKESVENTTTTTTKTAWPVEERKKSELQVPRRLGVGQPVTSVIRCRRRVALLQVQQLQR